MRILENYCQRSLDNEYKIKELKEYNEKINEVNKTIKMNEEWLKEKRKDVLKYMKSKNENFNYD